MAKNTTMLEKLLKKCKTMRDCFEVQNCLADDLSEEQEMALRAKYAGLSLREAYAYDEARKVMKTLEAKHVNKQLNEVMRTVVAVATH